MTKYETVSMPEYLAWCLHFYSHSSWRSAQAMWWQMDECKHRWSEKMDGLPMLVYKFRDWQFQYIKVRS